MINPTWRQNRRHAWNIVISCEKYKPDCSQIHIKVQNIECQEVSTLNTLSQAFSRKDGPIRNTFISYEKYKPDCSQIHVKVQNIEGREVSTLNTLSQAFSCKDVPIRNKVVSYEKYKPNHSQIHIKFAYWMLRCFHYKHIESELSLQRFSNQK